MAETMRSLSMLRADVVTDVVAARMYVVEYQSWYIVPHMDHEALT